MSKFTFFKEYMKNPKRTGSIIPSSFLLRKKMLESIDFSKDNVILEYGPGTGVFSHYIAEHITPSSIFILIDNNYKFVEKLKKDFAKYPNVFVICDTVEKVPNILKTNEINSVDYIISSLPFFTLGIKFSVKIFNDVKLILKPGGEFIFFQYTFLLEKNIRNIFPQVKKNIVYANIPPAFVYRVKV